LATVDSIKKLESFADEETEVVLRVSTPTTSITNIWLYEEVNLKRPPVLSPLSPPVESHQPLLCLHAYAQGGIQAVDTFLAHERQGGQPQERVQYVFQRSAATPAVSGQQESRTWASSGLGQLHEPAYYMFGFFEQKPTVSIDIDQVDLLQHLASSLSAWSQLRSPGE
jgi:hypothetical protein